MTFEEWNPEIVDAIMVRRNHQRHIYDLNGIQLCEDTVFPHSPFEDIVCWTYISSVIIKDNQEWREKLAKYNGTLHLEMYTAEGYGIPLFPGEEGLENAFNFLMNENPPDLWEEGDYKASD